jgi:ArsR family transcriptional regulator
MPVPLFQAKAEFFRMLGHPVRIRVLELLQDGPKPVRELLAETGIEPSSLSQQLAVLRRSGIVSATRHGTTVVYALTGGDVAELMRAARRILTEMLAGQNQLLPSSGNRLPSRADPGPLTASPRRALLQFRAHQAGPQAPSRASSVSGARRECATPHGRVLMTTTRRQPGRNRWRSRQAGARRRRSSPRTSAQWKIRPVTNLLPGQSDPADGAGGADSSAPQDRHAASTPVLAVIACECARSRSPRAMQSRRRACCARPAPTAVWHRRCPQHRAPQATRSQSPPRGLCRSY